MRDIGFTADFKVQNNIIQKSEALDEWINILNDLCIEACNNFDSICQSEKSEEEITKIARKNLDFKNKIQGIIDNIECYSQLKGIIISDYLRQQHPNLNYVANIFSRENNNKIKSVEPTIK